MCGIAGLKISSQDAKVALPKMLSVMRHRGPDNQGSYFFDEVSLGHRRLKIIDLSEQANQPMPNEDGSLWLVANGEIYNFKDLRNELERLGHRFRSFSDSEVVLHGYEEWGLSCLSRLRGMFAFCIFNQRQNSLFLARDRLGIKPLYYYYKNNMFIFASQVKAILASGLTPRCLSREALALYLDYGGIKDPFTIIEGITALMPGYYAVLDKSGLKTFEYWNLLNSFQRHSPLSYRDAVERTRFLLEEATRLQLVSDVPLGIFLSGGVDSASLLQLIAKSQSQKIKTVSLVFKEPAFDERRYSRLLARLHQTDHHEILLDEGSFLKDLPSAIEAMDQPTFDAINSYFVCRAAREAGLTVSVSGLGGDELFCGYPSFRTTPVLLRLLKILNSLPSLARIPLGTLFDKFCCSGPGKNKIVAMIKGSGGIAHPYFWIRCLFTEEQKNKLLKYARPILADYPRRLEQEDICNQTSYLELTNYMRDILLRDTDCMSMAHSLEVRVPFLDHRLVEFVFSLPGKFKTSGKINKPLLLNSLTKPLPQEITKRKKMGFVLPFACWLEKKLRDEVEDEFENMPKIIDEFLNRDGVSQIWNGFLKKCISWQRPWALYVLNKWVGLNNL